MKRVIFVLALLAIATTGTAFAQIQGGTVSGTVRDEQGGVLPGVTVTAQGVDATQTFITEATGEYRFLNLAPGPYKVTAALQGFTTMVRDNVIVSVGRNVELPLALKIAAVAETITVNGSEEGYVAKYDPSGTKNFLMTFQAIDNTATDIIFNLPTGPNTARDGSASSSSGSTSTSG